MDRDRKKGVFLHIGAKLDRHLNRKEGREELEIQQMREREKKERNAEEETHRPGQTAEAGQVRQSPLYSISPVSMHSWSVQNNREASEIEKGDEEEEEEAVVLSSGTEKIFNSV
jgi:hypothetical protein